MGVLLEARGLVKRFGERVAVDGISFSVGAGEIIGLLGPNGAGKTTTVSLVAGILPPDGGEVLLLGKVPAGDADPVKGELGLVPQELALYEELSALDNLHYFGGLYGLPRRRVESAAALALGTVGLAERARERVKTFSGGMKRRLNLAAGLLHDPKVLLLDEPTVGVDPQSRLALFEAIERLRDAGKAILYTTHYLEEAERLCSRLVIVDHGRVLADDTLEALRRRLPPVSRLSAEVEGGADPAWLPDLSALPGVLRAVVEEGRLAVDLSDLSTGSRAVLEWLSSRGVACTHLSSERPSLEAVFLALTGSALRDA